MRLCVDFKDRTNSGLVVDPDAVLGGIAVGITDGSVSRFSSGKIFIELGDSVAR